MSRHSPQEDNLQGKAGGTGRASPSPLPFPSPLLPAPRAAVAQPRALLPARHKAAAGPLRPPAVLGSRDCLSRACNGRSVGCSRHLVPGSSPPAPWSSLGADKASPRLAFRRGYGQSRGCASRCKVGLGVSSLCPPALCAKPSGLLRFLFPITLSRFLGRAPLQQQWERQRERLHADEPRASAGLHLHPQRRHGENPARRPA